MQTRPTDLSIAGAVDLSSLRAPAPPAPRPGPASGGGPLPGGGPAASPSSYVVDVTEATFETEVLRRSLTVPVLVDFWAEWCGPCKQLSPVLERLATKESGSWVLAKIDVDSNQALAGQLRIQSIPTVLLGMGGRLIQGFTGALPERDIRSFLEQVMAAATQAGLPGAGAQPDTAGEQAAAPPAEPELVAAEDALANEDYAAAEAAYDALLVRRPGDPLATGGKAWLGLLRRTQGADPQAVLAAAHARPDDVAAQCAAADIEVLADEVEAAVQRMVQIIRRSADDERQQAREHLLALFAVLEPSDPRVLAGRRALANALF